MPLRVGHDVTHLAERALIRARHQHVRRARNQTLDDLHDLRPRLARAKDDFRKTLPFGARIIHPRVSYVLEVQRADLTRR